jgi:hypothetical protein
LKKNIIYLLCFLSSLILGLSFVIAYINVNIPGSININIVEVVTVGFLISFPINAINLIVLETKIKPIWLFLSFVCIYGLGLTYYWKGGKEPFKMMGVYQRKVDSIHTVNYGNGTYYKNYKNIEVLWLSQKTRVVNLISRNEIHHIKK